MSGDKTEKIGAVVEPVLTAAGYDLEEVALLTPPGRRDVRIVVDRDGGASLDALADLSRSLDEALDAANVLGEQPYDLEVTTPGVGRPLTLERHWRRSAGRSVKIQYTADGSDHDTVARIGRIADGVLTLVKADKGRLSTVQVPLDTVTRAVVDVDFRRPGEAELRACGLDDVEIARRRERADD
ncbi:ribosome maturation factor RimP [Gordonia spumicola]|uniref:Ribosome maturation factor RimP n=1 Tax=Gordonia spumicola TaxID=589161 RepID=A0A7I9VB03_9ACTN|nr:ribosome maturation factor RimP [Gordonia spumicola]GEE02505.1 ribosome maturation factor RimP [Gordonia spumicola]